jgi:hypothetical protein
MSWRGMPAARSARVLASSRVRAPPLHASGGRKGATLGSRLHHAHHRKRRRLVRVTLQTPRKRVKAGSVLRLADEPRAVVRRRDAEAKLAGRERAGIADPGAGRGRLGDRRLVRNAAGEQGRQKRERDEPAKDESRTEHAATLASTPPSHRDEASRGGSRLLEMDPGGQSPGPALSAVDRTLRISGHVGRCARKRTSGSYCESPEGALRRE